jgi:ribonucleoside-diphosphate reductase alpha chain
MTYSHEEAMNASMAYFNQDSLASNVFVGKYALRNEKGELLESNPEQMHRRLAKEFARIEAKYPNPLSEEEIFSYLDQFSMIIPQGSPMAGIGNNYQVMSLGNCFTLPPPHDSYSGICFTDQQQAQIMKRRGGVGYDISPIRPKGQRTENAAGTTDGIGIFMERFSNTCREVAQCLHKDTLILTKNGLKPISEIKEKEDFVWTNDSWVKVEKVLKNTKKLQKLTTKTGKEILCSEDHIFHTSNGEKAVKMLKVGDPITQIVGEGWEGVVNHLIDPNTILPKRLSAIDKGGIKRLYKKENFSGQQIAKKYGIHKTTVYRILKNETYKPTTDIKLPEFIDEKLAYVLGLMYGDGYANQTKGRIEVAMSHDWPLISDKYVKYISDLFNYKTLVYPKSGEKCSVVKLSSKEITNFLSANGILKEKAANINCPKFLFNSEKNVVFAFISGYFDADGCVKYKKKSYDFTSIRKEFLLNIQIILNSFGIASKIHVEKREQKGWHNLYKLTINGTKSQNLFYDLMKESVKVTTTSRWNSKKADWTRTIYQVKDFGTKANKHQYLCNDEQFVSYSLSDVLMSDINKYQPIRLLQDQISSIESFDEKEHEVYDLVLPKEHLFFANGLYPHNSGRRGALLLSCHVKHPEISTFINIKKDKKKVTGANVSVRFSDDFMSAVKSSESYTQQFPVDSTNPKISFKTEAKKVWEEFINASWESAEPGALFWDTVQKLTPSDIYKLFGFQSVGVNPCAELILAAYDSCRLLLINLFGFIKNAFLPNSSFDKETYFKAAVIAQRLMDDLVDLELECIDKILSKIESDPEPDNVKAIEKELWLNIKKVCQNGRRTGTGITAIGDVLAALGIRYGSDESIEKTEELYKELAKATYTSSIIMAKERGAFPVCNVELEKGHPFIERILAELPEDIKEMYYKHGRRNIANTTTAPAGSVSLVARLIPGYFQTTSGIEPCVQPEYTRRKKINQNDKDTKVDFVDEMGDRWTEFKVYHPGFKLWKDITGKTEVKESPYFKATINDVDWKAGVQLQAAAQKWVCHSISKTVNLPKDASKELISEVFLTGWELGCKGLTVYRDGCRDGVLILDDNKINKEETIVSHHAPKRKKELNCDIHHATIQGEKWTIFVGLLGKAPYEVIGGLAKYVSIPKRVKSGKIVKVNGAVVPARYDLHYDYENPEEETVIKDIGNVFENSVQETFTRTISLSLRHGVPVQYIVEQLQKDNGKDSDLFSFNKGMARVLKKYIVDGTKASQKTCEFCGGTELIYKEGCVSCMSCQWSKCG